MRLRIVLFVALAAVIIAAGQWWRHAQPARDERVNILLITIDTLRADRLGCYGNTQIKTPHIDALAAEGVRFDRAFSAIPATLPSHATIMTGLYPHQHGVRDNGVYRLSTGLTTMAEMLHDAGYETAGFVSAFVLDRRFRIDQGFDVYDDEMADPLRHDHIVADDAALPEFTQRWLKQWEQPYQRRADMTAGRAIDWLSDRGESKPYFCWVHLFDPHLPYQPPPEWRPPQGPQADNMDGTAETFFREGMVGPGQYKKQSVDQMIALYDAEVEYVDDWVGRIVAAARALPQADRTLIIFLADHGEAFGEHGVMWEHISHIFTENVRIPLILAGADVPTPGAVRNDLVGTIDVLPTVLAAAALPMPTDLPGHSLLADAATTARQGDDGLYFETLCARSAIPTPQCFRGVRLNDWTLILGVEKPDAVRAAYTFETDGTLNESDQTLRDDEGLRDRLLKAYLMLQNLSRDDDQDPGSFWNISEDDERSDPLKSLGYVK